jgi:hypothetical protein
MAIPVMNRVRTVWNGVAGAPYYSNHYFTDTSIITDAIDATQAVKTFWDALTGNIVSGLNYLIEPEVARIQTADGQLVGAWTVPGLTGGGTFVGDQGPRASQGLITWQTGKVVAGRFLKGRTFIPGLGEPVNGPGGNPLASAVSGWTTAATALIADAGNELVVWSRTHGVAEPAVSGQGGTQWAVLRSRRD